MMFDNTPEPSPTGWQVVKDHVPILAAAGGLVALFIGLHTAATTVVVIAAGHLILGLGLMGFRALTNERAGQP